jgi:hypothetical protein
MMDQKNLKKLREYALIATVSMIKGIKKFMIDAFTPSLHD